MDVDVDVHVIILTHVDVRLLPTPYNQILMSNCSLAHLSSSRLPVSLSFNTEQRISKLKHKRAAHTICFNTDSLLTPTHTYLSPNYCGGDSGVTRWGRTARVTPSRGWHPNESKNIFAAEFTRTLDIMITCKAEWVVCTTITNRSSLFEVKQDDTISYRLHRVTPTLVTSWEAIKSANLVLEVLWSRNATTNHKSKRKWLSSDDVIW